MKRIIFCVLLTANISVNYSQSLKGLSKKAMEFFEAGNTVQAMDYVGKAEEKAGEKPGKRNKSYVEAITDLAFIYQWTGNYEKAESMFKDAIILTEGISGKKHYDYAVALDNLAELYYFIDKFDQSEALLAEASAIFKVDPGMESPEYATSLDDLGSVAQITARYKEADTYYNEAMNIRLRILGPEHPDYGNSLCNLASLYFETGNYARAESILIEVSEIWKKIYGPEHPDYANSLNNIALMNTNLGNYPKAETLFQEALRLYKKLPEPDDESYSNTLDNLASLYHNTGEYAKAEPLYMEALNIRKRFFGADHPEYALSLNNLATFYFEMGNYVKAEPLFIEGLEITKKTLGTENKDYATYLNNLALLYNEIYDYQRAEELYTEAMQIRKRILGTENIEYASSLNNLACMYNDMGNYVKAESLYTESLNITGKALGTRHPDYANALNNLAYLYNDMGRYSEAEAIYLEAIDIIKDVLGSNHAAYTAALNNLATVYLNMNNPDKAELLYIEANDNLNREIDNTFGFLSEKEKEQFLNNKVNNYFKKYNSFFLKRKEQNPAVTEVLYNNELAHKGMLLLSNTALRKAVYVSEDNELISIYEKFTEIHKKLSNLYTEPLAEREENTDSLEAIANDLEKELISKGKNLRGVDNLTGLTRTKWHNVQEALNPGEAAIEFVHFDYFDKKFTDSIFYCALVLRKGYPHPELIYLFEERELEKLLSTPLATTSSYYISKLYSNTTGLLPGNQTDPDKNILYRLVWQPIENLMDGVNTIYLAPGGLLNKLSFAAIPVTDSTYLSDKYALHIVSSTRVLAQNTRIPVSISRTDRAVLYGGIEYDVDSTEMIAQARQYQTSDLDFLASRSIILPEGKRGISWSYLPGTFTEIAGIQKIFSSGNINSTLLTGKNATEESFRFLHSGGKSPEILHIATHGFFFPETKSSDKNIGKEDQRGAMFNQPAFTLSDNPLFRSGILLSGAGRAWNNQQSLPGVEDGTLTAYEVSNSNLNNTKLVVLSACETGLGDIHGSEGVYGLQRAFKMAGAQYIIMSLWQVPDYQTSELMQLFYTNCIKGIPLKDAFRSAQQSMRKKYDPFYWAAFVFIE